MGVLACDRKGCGNIMCDICVDHSYYICYECMDQFKLWLVTQQPLYLDSNSFILEKFKEFMKVEKHYNNINIDIDSTIDKFFEEYKS